MVRLASAFAAFIVLLIVLANTRNLGPLMWAYDFPYGDKLGHILLYGGLTLLASLAVLQVKGRESAGSVGLVAAVMLVLVSLEELSQLFFSARRPDWLDLAASYAGVGWFTCLTLFLMELRRLNRVSLLLART